LEHFDLQRISFSSKIFVASSTRSVYSRVLGGIVAKIFVVAAASRDSITVEEERRKMEYGGSWVTETFACCNNFAIGELWGLSEISSKKIAGNLSGQGLYSVGILWELSCFE
jgi:hypothetical protein